MAVIHTLNAEVGWQGISSVRQCWGGGRVWNTPGKLTVDCWRPYTLWTHAPTHGQQKHWRRQAGVKSRVGEIPHKALIATYLFRCFLFCFGMPNHVNVLTIPNYHYKNNLFYHQSKSSYAQYVSWVYTTMLGHVDTWGPEILYWVRVFQPTDDSRWDLKGQPSSPAPEMKHPSVSQARLCHSHTQCLTLQCLPHPNHYCVL